MALILRPERWLAKPPAGTPLDHSHPLASGLRLFIPFTEQGGAARDVVTGRLAYVPVANGTWGTISGGGVGIRTTAAGPSGNLAFDAQWAIPFPLTVVYYGNHRNTGTPNFQAYYGVQTTGTNNGYGAYLNSDGTTHTFLAANSVYADTSIGTLTIGRAYQIAFTYDGATFKSYLDGVQKASAALTGAVTYVSGAFQVGNEGDSLAATNGISDILSLGIWNRVLAADALQQLTAAPYALLAPRATSHRFFVGGGGASAQALVGSAASTTTASGALTQTAAPTQALVGSAESATAASAVLTETPPAAQSLVGTASSQTSASGALSGGAPTLNLVGTAASASAAAAALTIAAATAQNLVGSASSATAASGALTQTPAAAQHLVGSAASATSASGSLGGETANWAIGVNNAGTGGNDMSPAAVRDSSNRLWRAANTSGTTAFDNSTGQYNNNTLRMFRCTTTGVPSAFTEQDSAHRPTNVGSFSIAIDGSDTIHVAFVHTYAAATTGIYYTTFNTSTNLWSGVETKIGTANYATTATYLPGDAGVSMALDASGVPHVVHYGQVSGTGTTHIFYTNKVGGTWSAAVQLDTATLGTNQRCMHPQCMFDSTGALHAVWMTITFNYGTTLEHCYYIKRSSGGTWGSVTQFAENLLGSLDNGPALYVSEDDHVHIAYGLGDGTDSSLPTPNGEVVTGTTVNNAVFYRFSSNGGATWNTTTQPPHFVSHDFNLGPSGDGAGGIHLWSHSQPTTVQGLGTAIGYASLPGGSGTWVAWAQKAIDTNQDGFDCTVSPRRETFFHNRPAYLDVAYFDLNLPVSAMLGSDPSGLVITPMVGTAQSATAASGVLTLTPAAPQPLVGSALSQSAATAALTIAAAAAQSLAGAASSASSASAALTQTPAPAQPLGGAAAAVTAASAALTQSTPPGVLVGTAAATSRASAALTITPPPAQPLTGTASGVTSASGLLSQASPPAQSLVGRASSATAAAAILTLPVRDIHLTGSASAATFATAVLRIMPPSVPSTDLRVTITEVALVDVTITDEPLLTVTITDR